jgi:hypothetical protein
MTASNNQIQSLDQAICALKDQRKKEFGDLKVQFIQTSEHFRPVNLLTQTIKDLGGSPVLKTNLFETLISVTGGYFSKKMIMGKSNSFTKKIVGYVLQYGITNFISKKVSSNVNG